VTGRPFFIVAAAQASRSGAGHELDAMGELIERQRDERHADAPIAMAAPDWRHNALSRYRLAKLAIFCPAADPPP
jgi:hypothetical protein